jgi:hypothetical protein
MVRHGCLGRPRCGALFGQLRASSKMAQHGATMRRRRQRVPDDIAAGPFAEASIPPLASARVMTSSQDPAAGVRAFGASWPNSTAVLLQAPFPGQIVSMSR